MNEWQARPEVLSDGSVVWNVYGRDDDNQTEIVIGCSSQKTAKQLAKYLNDSCFVQASTYN